MLLPITGIGKASVAQVQNILQKSPKGFPSPLMPVDSHILPEEQYLISNWAWYDKKVIHTKIDYPSELKSFESFFHSKDTSLIRNKPFIFLNNDLSSVSSVNYSTNSIVVNVKLNTIDTLIVLQNYFPGWTATVNKESTSIIPYLKTFIAVPLQPNAQTVRLQFCIFKDIPLL